MKSFLAGMVVAVFLALSFVTILRITKDLSPEIRYDTLFVYDTLRDTIPQLIQKEVIRYKRIPVYLPDTTVKTEPEIDTSIRVERIYDTVYVSLPIESKEYKTDRYFAIVEGYEPVLRYIETYDKTRYVTGTGKRKGRWGFGVQSGVGYTFDGKPTPYIGIGIQYNLITW